MTEAEILAAYAELQREIYLAGRFGGTNIEVAVAYACSDLVNSVRNCTAEDRLAIMADEVAYTRELLDRERAA